MGRVVVAKTELESSSTSSNSKLKVEFHIIAEYGHHFKISHELMVEIEKLVRSEAFKKC